MHHPIAIDDISDVERNVAMSDAMATWPFDPFRTTDECLEEIRTRVAVSPATEQLWKQAIAMIEPDDHARFLNSHAERLKSFDPLGASKYAEIPYWAFRNVVLAEWLGLDHASRRRILDIGMGPGSFAMVAKSMGHHVVGTDVADPWYEELCQLVGVERRILPVVRGEPYLVDGGPFDLITIMLPAFHRHSRKDGTRDYWSTGDWHSFLLDQVENNLNQTGEIFILMPLDKRQDGRLTYSPLLQWAARRGARLGQTHPGSPVRHIHFDRPHSQLVP